MRKSFFITLEGADGCGKSTQARALAERLRKKGFPVVLTREPGGTRLAEGIRSLILNAKLKVHPLSELLLYEASRAQHTEEIIRPALARKKIVVSDRYADATVAYQGCGRGLPQNIIRTLNGIATGGLKPDLTLYLEVSEKTARERTRGRFKDRLEREERKFHARVKLGYSRIAKAEPGRVKTVSGEGPVGEVAEKIWKITAKRLGIKNV